MRYDLAIIGAGPAGLSASVYASRYGIKNIIIGGISGGLVTETHEIGNWLGTQKISGFEFAQKAIEHVKSLQAEIKTAEVDEIEKNGDNFVLFLKSGEKLEARAVLLAMGTKHRHLRVAGEKEFSGKGVSYCATCDGFFYRGKKVAVVGGSDSAASAALHLASIAEKVFLIYRKDKLRAEDFWVQSVLKNEKIEVLYNTNIKEIKGNEKVKEIILDNFFKDSDVLKIDGVFVEIGLEPNVNLVENLNIDLDEDGHIKIESDGRTTEKGIWAAGDITTGSDKFKQIVTAAAEGAIAASSISKYLKK
ncbi:MAG: Thioredoxin reductase (TrxB-3) [Candidatus Moranbacteria bacterium GW2011_GWE2_35_2-]|nr:MAG: Thioredoxin reductase (TrxB-3) [Candidatus Moranbacteria bacterium GW2011_GWE2_35_2-]KKQ22755.1 MAG: Thioredoxin reductase (TrxB-3) [Candidatus Moranbacteria bacterium GW2011_GWF2_37_11]KKQ28909.1 MAG: Thioredoxin reductase (TrxB-3) [Candidatus Moranbacteria bacterium GW2011_GWD1_37_17]KKQ31014.1 MAG: Thioredoxin reductase (TrxB-3) [Candidatus Moranbacteria bacterium GW2011_GWE1_37_24]KKQ48076.1 MAG: Thioredoxin reductase (TrxB-3) [Candidatus Moranbacteria bacterium GW2011_GWD2_37_9]HB